MLRRISYRSAATAFVFTGLWFVIGLLLLLSPIPGALGIGRQMFAAWLVAFLLALGASGAALFLAAVNGIFPPIVRPPARSAKLWSAQADAAPPLPRRPRSGNPPGSDPGRAGRPANTRGG